MGAIRRTPARNPRRRRHLLQRNHGTVVLPIRAVRIPEDCTDQQSQLPESRLGNRERRKRVVQRVDSAAEYADGISVQLDGRAADPLEHCDHLELRWVTRTALGSRSVTEYPRPSVRIEQVAGL